MKLYFNGCSHTNGDDLADRNHAWPAVVASARGCEFFNDAVSGGSNDRIVYQTMKHIDDFDQFYIAWTYTSRFTQYRSDNNHEVNFNCQLKHALYQNCSEFQDYGKLHYAYWHNELFAFKLWLQKIILLQNLLEARGKSYVMLNTDHNFIDRWSADWPEFNNSVKSLLCFDIMNDQQLYQEHREIQSLLSQIDLDRFVGWNSWWIIQDIEKYPRGKTNHYLEQGHRAVADYILKHDTN